MIRFHTHSCFKKKNLLKSKCFLNSVSTSRPQSDMMFNWQILETIVLESRRSQQRPTITHAPWLSPHPSSCPLCTQFLSALHPRRPTLFGPHHQPLSPCGFWLSSSKGDFGRKLGDKRTERSGSSASHQASFG